MLGEIDADLRAALGVDAIGVPPRTVKYGSPPENWKPFRLHDGLVVLAPGGLNCTVDSNGNTLLHPQGDLSAPGT
jgi:hypothetical protein